MPIPNTLNDLYTDPTLCSPSGSEPIGNNLDNYLRAGFSFIKQVSNGTGITLTQNFNLQGFKLTNVANAVANTDAVTLGQLKSVFRIGEIRQWHGAVANIATVWGAGWQLADGTNGTADLRDRFLVGAGNSYAANATGGLTTNVLSIAQLPSHGHGVNETPHGHLLNDPGHNHPLRDPGHIHNTGNIYNNTSFDYGLSTGGGAGASNNFTLNTSLAGTGITLSAAGTGITLNTNTTGISIQATGSGAGIENRPPYYALCFLEFTGIGVS